MSPIEIYYKIQVVYGDDCVDGKVVCHQGKKCIYLTIKIISLQNSKLETKNEVGDL